MNMTKNIRGLIVGIALAAGAIAGLTGQAFAGQDGRINPKPNLVCEGLLNTPSTWEVRYNSYTQTTTPSRFALNLSNNGAANCQGHFKVTSVTGGIELRPQGPGDGVPFSLRLEGSNRDITPRPSSDLSRGGEFTVLPGQVGIQNVLFTVTPNSNLPAGRYTLPVIIEFDTGSSRGGSISKPVNLVLVVESLAVIGIKGEFTRVGGTPTINLGTLETGVKAPMTQVYVRSTNGYILTVASENRGQLVHQLPGWSIGYSMRMGSQNINLTRPHEIRVPVPQASPEDYPLSFTIGDVANKRAGRYSDTIHLTITAI